MNSLISPPITANRCTLKGLTPQDLGRQLAFTRREFLRAAAGLSRGSGLMASSRLSHSGFAPEGQENIPHLIRELTPQSAFFSQVVNRGILGHYVATASLATGRYETFNNFSAVPPENPTVFEYFRKDLKRPAADAWVVAPSNGFHRIGESGNRRYGAGLGAGVILPKRLLAAALSGSKPGEHEHLPRDNYERYYNWINQRRLAETEQSSFLAWFENHSQAVAIGPSMPRGTASTESATLANLLSWMA